MCYDLLVISSSDLNVTPQVTSLSSATPSVQECTSQRRDSSGSVAPQRLKGFASGSFLIRLCQLVAKDK